MAGPVPPSLAAAAARRDPRACGHLDEERARGSAWGLLARLLLAPPDASLLAALAEDDRPSATPIPSDLESAFQALAAAASAMPADLVAEEYAALFEAVGAPLVDPYASHYLAGFPMERPLAELRRDLAALGLARARGARVTEDHLGALAEAMRVLVAGAPPRVDAQPLVAQRDFFARHIEPWAARCLDDVEAAAAARFYGCVARWARALVAVECEAFELLGNETQEDVTP